MIHHPKPSQQCVKPCRRNRNNLPLLKVSYLISSKHQRCRAVDDAQVVTKNTDPCPLCLAPALSSMTFCALFKHFLIVLSLLFQFLYALFSLFLEVDYNKMSKSILRFFFGTVYLLTQSNIFIFEIF